ncbi:MAG: peptide chain release factor 1 [Moorea sp. SIO1F2]|uniref:peptide chain release factor 1 n=1 Tax=unclassified Moorena TaxID=2683338 RepID=UPI0013BE0743|nr:MULTISPECIES: peptide chain release factor 1 [unclassified Moorena]NEO21975.1 peptide chain release factor 1 [Moorena sp. SIO4A5]NEQ61259.1 peptide chain release factor 1 [Moorena sp. SIO4A1]NET80466.1 peptide chain release factor 1 [Moorena sp. SIO1F2]
MNDPWNTFKQQPWLPLSKVAALTTVLVVALENLLIWVLTQSETFRLLLFSRPLAIIWFMAAAIGVGVLGVYICERWQSQVFLKTSSLWALVLCLIVGLLLKSQLPIPFGLVGFSMNAVIGVILGVFWKGRPYWRYWN